jgi:hypothetical protein
MHGYDRAGQDLRMINAADCADAAVTTFPVDKARPKDFDAKSARAVSAFH